MAGVPTLAAKPGAGFEFTVVDLDPLRVAIRAAGELDLAARDALFEVLDEHTDARRRIIHLDLSQVAFIDCSCLGALVASHHRMRDRHGMLVLTGVGAFVARVFRLTGLDDLLFVASDDQDPFGDVLVARSCGRSSTHHHRSLRLPSSQKAVS